MRSKVLLSVLLILTIQMLGAQDFKTLYGIVTDSGDDSPLHLASVNLSGSNINNVTNADGVFSLKIPIDTKPDAIVSISYLGYDRNFVPVSAFEKSNADNPLRIRMRSSVISLDAARIIDMDAYVMFLYAYQHIRDNYPQEHEAMVAFYREMVMKNSSKYLSMNEAVLDIAKVPYYSGAGDKAGIYKGRGSSNYDSTDSLLISYKGGVSGALLLDMVKNPFAGISFQNIYDVFKYYDFQVGIPSTINGRFFHVLEFDQNASVGYALYRGRIYMDPDSYAIARVELDLNVEDFPEVVADYVRKIPKNTKMEMISASYIINYKEAEDGKWHYDYSRSEIALSARKKYSLFKTNYTITSEMAVTDHYPGRLSIDDESLMKFGDIMATKLEDFTDPDFWGSYNIIEPDSEIDVIIRRIIRQLRRREQ
ncbi:MAG: carboxypeptidase-like regulatory domain-containing protein [Bacteroidales bacterium]|nr:carboxypeptidase-like regulatory domain-containing protein [Bacteroidales bacterium]